MFILYLIWEIGVEAEWKTSKKNQLIFWCTHVKLLTSMFLEVFFKLKLDYFLIVPSSLGTILVFFLGLVTICCGFEEINKGQGGVQIQSNFSP